MRKEYKAAFFGGIDKDSNERFVKVGDYVDAKNIVNGWGSHIGELNPIEGNRLVEYTLPEGGNKCIGAIEDHLCESIVYFIWNSTGDHLILRYYPDGTINEICRGSFLDFQRDHFIQSKIVDGKYLYFVDGKPSKDGISGNEPRKINLEKAEQKKYCYRLEVGVIEPNERFDLIIRNGNTNTNTVFSDFFIAPNENNVIPYYEFMLGRLAESINVRVDIDYEVCASIRMLKICLADENIRIELTSNSNKVVLVPDNHYPLSYDEKTISLIKPQPALPLKAVMRQNPSKTSNITGCNLQFTYRYIYDDSEKSAWACNTPVLTNYKHAKRESDGTTDLDHDLRQNYYYNSNDFTEVAITIQDPIISDLRHIIKYVEIGVRYSESEPYRLVRRYNTSELGVLDIDLIFDNSENLTVIPSDVNSLADQQAFKVNDFVPLKSCSIESVVSDEGLSRLALYNNLEYYELDDCAYAEAYIVPYDLYTNLGERGEDVFGRLINPNSQDLLQDNLNINNSDQFAFKTLKKGGLYEIGVIFKDYAGRSSNVQFISSFEMPRQFHHFPVIVPSIEAPDWAYSYSIVITKNKNQSSYIQLPVTDVKYGFISQEKEESRFLDYGDADITHMVVRFSNAYRLENDNEIFREMISGAWTPQRGDYIAMNYFPKPDEYPSSVKSDTYRIAGYSLGFPTNTVGFEEDLFILVDYVENMTNFQTNGIGAPTEFFSNIELYRRLESAPELYHEIKCGIVSEWNNNVGLREDDIISVSLQNNDILLGDRIVTERAISAWTGRGIDLKFKGDTYIGYYLEYLNATENSFYVSYTQVETNRLHSEVERLGGDHGRAFAKDDDIQRYNYSQIRLSDVFSYKGVNGLSSYRPTEYITIKREYGLGRKLVAVGNVLLAIAEKKTQPIYVGKGELLDLSGNTTIGRTSKLLNIANEFQPDLGTSNPESIIVEEGRVYAWDSYKGAVWRYTSGGGQFAISEFGLRNEFLERRTFGDSIALGGFDRNNNSYMLSFPDKSWVFQEKGSEEMQNPKWACYLDKIPDFHARVGLQYVTIKDGSLYVHDGGNEIYREQIESSVTFVVNADPSDLKIFWNIVQQSDALWHSESIKCLPNSSYISGMESELIPNKWELLEGNFHADFLRDALDPSFNGITDPLERKVKAMLSGRTLRGEVLLVTLNLQKTSNLATLRGCDIFYTFSNKT